MARPLSYAEQVWRLSADDRAALVRPYIARQAAQNAAVTHARVLALAEPTAERVARYAAHSPLRRVDWRQVHERLQAMHDRAAAEKAAKSAARAATAAGTVLAAEPAPRPGPKAGRVPWVEGEQPAPFKAGQTDARPRATALAQALEDAVIRSLSLQPAPGGGIRWTVKGTRPDGHPGYMHGLSPTLPQALLDASWCLQKQDWRVDRYG